GAAAPKDKTLDGESLLPLFKGAGKLKRQAIFWHFPGYLDDPVIRGRDPVFRSRPVSVIRKGDWKLHLYHEEWQLGGGREKIATNNAVELYNISASHVTYSTLRMEPQYMMIGQAAGVAAKMALENNVAAQEINTKQLSDKLKSQGAVFEWKKPDAK